MCVASAQCFAACSLPHTPQRSHQLAGTAEPATRTQWPYIYQNMQVVSNMESSASSNYSLAITCNMTQHVVHAGQRYHCWLTACRRRMQQSYKSQCHYMYVSYIVIAALAPHRCWCFQRPTFLIKADSMTSKGRDYYDMLAHRNSQTPEASAMALATSLAEPRLQSDYRSTMQTHTHKVTVRHMTACFEQFDCLDTS